MSGKGIIASGAILILSACGSTTQPPLRGMPDPKTGIGFDTRLVQMDSCVLGPGGPEAAPLLGTLAAVIGGQLASATVKSIGEGLTAAGKEKTYQISATQRLALSEEAPVPCLYFLRGRFYDNVKAAQQVSVASIGLNRYTDEVHERFLNSGVWLADKPDLLMELAPVRQNGALGYDVGYLWYGKPIAPSSGGDNVVVLELSLRPPGIAHNDTKAPAVQVVLGNLTAPALFSPPGDTGMHRSLSRPLQTPWMKIDSSALNGSRLQVTADVRLAETIPQNPILTTLGAALTGSATEVGTAVKSAIDPAARTQAETTAFQAQKTLLAEYWKTVGEAENAIVACRSAAAGERRAKGRAARGLQEQANLLAGRVGKEAPYAVLIDLENPDCSG